MVSRSTPRTVVLTAKVRMAPTARKKRLIPVATMASWRGISAFAGPHGWTLFAFLVLSVVSAVLAVATPVLAGWVVDAIIKKGSEARVMFLAGAIAAVAVLDAVVGIAERWQSSRI